MDIYHHGRHDNTPVDLWSCTGSASQQWHARDGALVNPASGKCLNYPRLSIAAGTQLQIDTCTGADNQ